MCLEPPRRDLRTLAPSIRISFRRSTENGSAMQMTQS